MNRPYYGWWVVLASAIGLAVSPGPVAFYSIGVLMQPLAESYGWNRAEVSFVATALTLSTFATMPFIGAAIDRFGAKQVLVPSMIAFGLALFACGFATTLTSLYVMYAIVGVACAGTNSVAYMQVLSVWFDRRRGIAIGVACAGMGLGFAFIPGFTQALVDRGGVQLAYAGLAALVLCVGVPVVAIVFRNAPRPEQVRPSEFVTPAASTEQGILGGATAREAAGMLQFWAILLIFAIVGGAVFGVALHLVSIVRALDPVSDASIMAATIFGLMSIVGRIVGGYLFDKHLRAGCRRGRLSYRRNRHPAPREWLAIRMGSDRGCSHRLLVGAEADALAILCSRYFGLRAYGKIYSYVFAATLIGISTVPFVLGVGYEHFDGYAETLFTTGALLALGALLTAVWVASRSMTQTANACGASQPPSGFVRRLQDRSDQRVGARSSLKKRAALAQAWSVNTTADSSQRRRTPRWCAL